MQKRWIGLLWCALALPSAGSLAQAQTVKVIPLGSHPGEFCRADRAIMFEDPTGVRILYDAGQTIVGGSDPRLGNLHVALLSHGHGDHIGDRVLTGLNQGTCNVPTVVAAPDTNLAAIVAAKNSAIVTDADLGTFLAKKIEKISGKAVPVCKESGPERTTVVPEGAACLATTQIGGARTIKLAGQTKGVEITVVPAQHSGNIPPQLLSEPLRKELAAEGLNAYVGQATGYILAFSNGLKVYLTGDTALTGDMKTVIHDFYHPDLVVISLGSNIIPTREAAYAINVLLQPKGVIPEHANEWITENGKVRAGTRTKELMDLVKDRPVYIPISDRTMEFDGQAKCVAGCS